ncbi:MAG: aminodeoxychorismate synthase component I [Acidobacteriaceae bacterium]
MPTPNPHARWTPLPSAVHALVEASPNAILLETSRYDAANHHSYLFLNPTRILTANTFDEIPALFAQIEAALAEGLHVAGYLSYECNGHFEPSAAREITQPSPSTHDIPLAHLAAYPAPILFDHATGVFLTLPPPLPGKPSPSAQDPSAEKPSPSAQDPSAQNLRISDADYLRSIERIQNYIAAGDTYQVNFTDAIEFRTTLSPATLFTALSQQQSVAYAAFLNLTTHHILSLSPELFFRIETQPNAATNKITTRPMKGTMPRGLDTAEDALAIQCLRHDEKNRAEHVMIVDLLRNDLGRIAATGTVRVDDLFSIERYETLFQMTSTISATLRPSLTFYDIFRALFPCGSITGAPKIRTMQIIRELEAHPRGIYTGVIGFIAPNRNAVFSVAIRTLVLANNLAHMGVGGGIVADSVPEAEHREALLKASFLTRIHQPFELIETLLFDHHYQRLPLHLDRLESSAAYFNFTCDRISIEAQLRAFAHFLDPRAHHRIRLLLDRSGKLTLTSEPLALNPATVAVMISPHRTHSTDPYLRHKTTNRRLYNDELTRARAAGFDEVLFLNERNELTEGAISNLFLEIPATPSQPAQLLTPPLASGVLPGIMRRHLLETLPNAQERVLTLADLQPPSTLYLCSSLRGLRKVTSLHLPS